MSYETCRTCGCAPCECPRAWLPLAALVVAVGLATACGTTTQAPTYPTPTPTRSEAPSYTYTYPPTVTVPTPTTTQARPAAPRGNTRQLPAVPKPRVTKAPVHDPAAAAPRASYYANCAAAKKAGAAPLHAGDPGYRIGLDKDHDGTACE